MTTAEREVVQLTMPADPSLWLLARHIVNVVASRANYPPDVIDDLRIAVSELCSCCASGVHPEVQVALRVALDPEQIEVECTAAPMSSEPGPLDGLSEQILDHLADEHYIEARDGERHAWLRRHTTPVGHVTNASASN